MKTIDRGKKAASKNNQAQSLSRRKAAVPIRVAVIPEQTVISMQEGERTTRSFRVFQLVAVLTLMASPPAAMAQRSSGYMDLEEMSGVGPRLIVVRVMFSSTDAIFPQQTGMFRIGPHGGVTDVLAVLRGKSPDYRMDPTSSPDDFTHRRRIATDSCCIDIDIREQQKRNDVWISLTQTSSTPANMANPSDGALRLDHHPTLSATEHEAYRRAEQAVEHAGSVRQGVTLTVTGGTGFQGIDDCLEAIGNYLIDESGVTLLFPTGLGREINRFFIERVDVDANHSTLYLSRGTCRVGFTISASTLQEGSWVSLPIAPPTPLKVQQGAEKN